MIGISVYPTKFKTEESIKYIKKAAKLGYKRIFASLLDVTSENKDEVLEKFRTVFNVANSLNMEVTIDVNPRLFKTLNVDYNNLKLFSDIGAKVIRLDANFDGMTEAMMSFSDSDLDFELNLSNDAGNIDNIFSYLPNKNRLRGCHNFYPQRFTGLDLDFFKKCTDKYKKLGLRTAAFVTSQKAEVGPHPFNDKLPTLEMHRDLPIKAQAKHLFAMGNIDDVIISNQMASDQELKALASVDPDVVTLDVDLVSNDSQIEKDILFNYLHFNRGDINSYSIRSTFIKLKYKDKSIPAHDTNATLYPGDIVIGNDSFGQYKGEVNIVKKEIPNTGFHKNVIAHILNEENILISYIKPWQKFKFEK